jgi:Cys-rich protein (TIGR01571 family)
VRLLQNASMLYGMLLPILCLWTGICAMTPQEVVCGGNYCGACCLYALLTAPQIAIDILTLPVTSILLPLGTCVHFPMRSTIRKKYNIPGNDCEDCLTVWLCACCALAQVQHKKL